MSNTKTWGAWIVLAVIIIAIGSLLLWLKPADSRVTTTNGTAGSRAAGTPGPTAVFAQAQSSQLPPGTQLNGPLPTLAPSLQGTQIDCPLVVSATGELTLTPGIRNCFDYFFTSIGEKTESQLIADIRQYLKATLPASAQAYAIKLLDQYVAYKHAESTVQGKIDTQNPDSIQTVLNQLKQLRRQFFSAAEAEVFFGDEEAYNQYTIDSIRIMKTPGLSASEKAAKTAALINQLPPEMAENMRTSMQYDSLQKLTEEIKAKNGSPAELRQMREQLVGAAAADRLAALDTEQASWRSKVDSYLADREKIRQQFPEGSDRDQAIASLRERQFATPEERLRAESYEAMKDRGEKFPD